MLGVKDLNIPSYAVDKMSMSNSAILVVDDDQSVRQSLGKFLTRIGYAVTEAADGAEAVELFHRNSPDVVLLDLHLPDSEGYDVLERLRDQGAAVIVITGDDEVGTAVGAMQAGAENFLTKPVDLPHLAVAVSRVCETVQLRRKIDVLRSGGAASSGLSALGVSPNMRELARQIKLLAASGSTTVLLTGESGTGKGFVARLIHDLSPRADAPFVDINAAGLNPTFLDSELFGHEKGAFTDAKERKRGLFELAQHGTVFLDEIGDLASELQPKLLKVLESKTFRRVGGTHSISVDVRLIAATNRDLTSEVRSDRFREDLYYRLSVLPIHMIPVRERSRDDRMALLEFLLADVSRGMATRNATVDSTALRRLLDYAWPGNVREMRNVLERAMILASGDPVRTEHLPAEIRTGRQTSENGYEPMSLDEVERRHIERTLRSHKGNRTHAAKQLGISRATLIKKIKIYELTD